ncbi:MAG TPA: hypothetical protein VJO52_05270 [Gemmatimonadaceae bacterium]|nr:hypothetical protein [Gemmatimonadaceae bacterium]
MRPNLRFPAADVAWFAATLLLAACSSEAPTGTLLKADRVTASSWTDTVSVCHRTLLRDAVLEIPGSALPAHLAQGDYPTTLIVSHTSDPSDDGIHFRRIGDALDAARTGRLARGESVAAACRITILVSDGTYQGSVNATASADIEQFPFIVDVPDITLRGALSMQLDEAGRATGEGTSTAVSTLTPIDPMPVIAGVSTPIIIANAHPGGSAGNGLTVEGFVFQSGHDPAVDAGGQGVLAVRATGLTIRGNRFEGGFTESIDLRGASGDVVHNHLSGTAGTCDICLAGPGRYRARGNRLLAGGIPGIVAAGPIGLHVPNGVEPFVLPATAETFAEIVNNEISDHTRVPVGAGIRLDALGPGAPNVVTTLHADIRRNHLVNNRFGIIIHAGFPVAGTALRGDIDATIRGNTFDQICQAKLLVSFSRHTTALGLTTAPYFLNTTYRLTLGRNLDWSEAWFGDPDGFGNQLIVNGQLIANGIRQFYDPVGCPGD